MWALSNLCCYVGCSCHSCADYGFRFFRLLAGLKDSGTNFNQECYNIVCQVL